MIWIPAILTAWLFAMSGVCGQRLTRLMDPMWANLLRLTFAGALLTVIAQFSGGLQLSNAAFGWFFFSGVIGFGFGDIALFLAYAKIGARLTLLINLCLAPLFAAAGEWILLDNTITLMEFAAMLVALVGVALAVTGRRPSTPHREREYPLGVLLAVVAGLGQGLGAVLSRLAEGYADPVPVNALSQAFQRCLGGWLILMIATWWWCRQLKLRERPRTHAPAKQWWPWLAGAVLCGPVVGVTLFQWSLVLVGNSAFVQAIVSTTPIALIPLVYFFEKEVPTPRSIVGAFVAVAGVVAICLLEPSGA